MSYHNIIITAFCSQMQSVVFISKFIRHPEQNGVAQYWDWPSKKGARERTDMDWLKDILGDAHTEDIDKKIASYIGKNFVSKADFRAESDKVKNLEGQIAERDSQLEELKKVDTAGLQATITQLQNENKQAKAKYDSDIAAMKLDSAIDAAITAAKGKNARAIKALITPGSVKLDKDGKLEGFDDQLKAIRESDAYLFDKVETRQRGGDPDHGGGDPEPGEAPENYADYVNWRKNQ